MSWQLVRIEQAGAKDETLYIKGQLHLVRKKDVVWEVPPIWVDPWVWQYAGRIDRGTTKVEVTVLDPGGERISDEIDAGVPLNEPGKTNVERWAPRLVLALNTTPLDPRMPYLDGNAQSLEQILNHIWKRLTDGLASAWIGPDGSRGLPLEQAFPGDEERTEQEWARQISEMLVCVPYGCPGRSYTRPDITDKEASQYDKLIYEKMCQEGGPYPLVAACQHLSTMGLISRGFTTEDFGYGANAGGSKHLKVFDKKGGKGSWNTSHDLLKPKLAVTSGELQPGSLYEFNVPPPNSPGSHIAFVLRIHRPEDGQDSWHGVQFFDTGAVTVPNRKKGVTITGGPNYDNPWNVERIAGPTTFSGAGVLKAPKNHAGLQSAVGRMRLAWPLGFARLAFYDRGSKDLLYATPLLRMNTADAYQNFSLARLAWSLREMPGKAGILAKWMTYLPQGKLSEAMWNGTRSTKLAALVASAGGLKIRRHTDLSVESGGTVRIRDASEKADPFAKHPWGQPAGAVQPKDIPKYFTGA